MSPKFHEAYKLRCRASEIFSEMEAKLKMGRSVDALKLEYDRLRAEADHIESR